MKKKGIKYFLSLIALSCSIVYLLLRIFGILDNKFHFKTYKVFAADTTTSTTPALSINTDMPTPEIEHRVLSYEETIGLYGNRIQLTYTGLDEIDKYLQLELIGAWDTPRDWPSFSSDSQLWDPPGSSGAHWGNLNILWWYPTQPPNDRLENSLKYSDYLIYGCYFPAHFDFETTSSIVHPNITFTVDFPEGIEVNYFGTNVLYSRSQSSTSSPGWSVIRTYGSQTFSTMSMEPAANGSAYGQSIVTPFPQYVDNESGVNLGVIPYFQGNVMNQNKFTISQQVFRLNGCDLYETTVGGWFLVYIQRPEIISNITWPTPPPTTRPPETTRADFTTYNLTYDLSPLETNQINQIRLQNEQLQVELAQLNGINYICRKLDDIYNQMVERGEIPVDLIPADKVQLYNSDVRDSINGILTSYTTSQLPNYDYQMDFVHRAFLFLWAEPWIAALGGLSLCASVAAWIIFEGRRG